MDDTTLPLSTSSVLQRLVTDVLGSADVVLLADHAEGHTLLDLAADDLSAHRSRTIRVSAGEPGGLSVTGLLAQVAGQPVAHDRDDQDLARDFRALTALDGTCDRIVLLVSDAHALQPSALRFIQLACRRSADLLLVFAGAPGLFTLLDEPEFADLATRLERTTLAVTPPIIVAPLPAGVIPRGPAPTPKPSIVPLPASATPLPAIVPLRPIAPPQPALLVVAAPLAPRTRMIAPGSARPPGRSRPAGRATAAALAVTCLIMVGVYIARANSPIRSLDPVPAAKMAASPSLAMVPSTTAMPPQPTPDSPPVRNPDQHDITPPAQATGPVAAAPQAARPPIVRRDPSPTRAYSRYAHSRPQRDDPTWYEPNSRPSALSQPAPDPYYRWTPNPPGNSGVIGTYTTDANGIRSFHYGP